MPFLDSGRAEIPGNYPTFGAKTAPGAVPFSACGKAERIASTDTRLLGIFPSTLEWGRFASFVYLIQADNGLVKIGRSIDPAARLRTFACGSAVRLELLHAFVCQDATETEFLLHALYRDRLHHGEWYALSLGQIDEVRSIRFCTKLPKGEFFFALGGWLGLQAVRRRVVVRWIDDGTAKTAVSSLAEAMVVAAKSGRGKPDIQTRSNGPQGGRHGLLALAFLTALITGCVPVTKRQLAIYPQATCLHECERAGWVTTPELDARGCVCEPTP